MYTHSGNLKVNKKDIEGIKVFLAHAKADMRYGQDGTYVTVDRKGEDSFDEKEYKKGMHGLECIEFMLDQLCDKWE